MSTGVARETAGRSRPEEARVARETAAEGPPGQARAAGRESKAPARHEGCGDHEAAVARATTPSPTPTLPARVVLAPIRLYRRRLSPLLGARCRYYPTCSAYAEQAVSELGLLRGFIVAFWRLLRCNPFSPGGIDPVESRRLFRSEGADADAEHREVPT